MSSSVLEKPRKKKPTKRRPPRLDPVTAYARAVVEGRKVVGRAVRLACERHLRDLARQRTVEFPYEFNAAAAQHLIDFFAEFLPLEDGRPFVLTDWQEFCFGSIFGWKRVEDGGRRFQIGYIETGKGSGKTPALAGVGIYGIVCDGEESAELYSAAFDREQASILLNDAIRMAGASEDLVNVLDIGKYNIAHPASNSFFRAVSSEHRSKSGPRPHIVLIDELHEHRDGTVVNKMRAGFKFRTQPLLLEITNSGHDRTSICWQHHVHSLNILEDTVADEQWFAYVCQLDPCEKCFSEGYRQPKDGCPDCDDWTDPEVWPKVNPSLGITIQEAYLRTQVDLALAMPADQAMVKRLNFCLWTESHEIWIPSNYWDACRVDQVLEANPDGRPCAAGMDLADLHDLAATVVAVRFDDPPSATAPEVVAIEGMNEEGERVTINVTLNFSVDIIPYAWLPEETLHERVTKERVPFDVWARPRADGRRSLIPTPGPVIDHQAIYEAIAKDLWKRFKIQRLGYDLSGASMLATKLRDEARLGDKVVAVGQGKKLSEAFKLIGALVRTRRLRHNGDPVLAWCVANAEPKRDRLNALWIEKPSDTKRIDLAVAMAMAIHQLMLLPAKRRGVGVMVI